MSDMLDFDMFSVAFEKASRFGHFGFVSAKSPAIHNVIEILVVLQAGSTSYMFRDISDFGPKFHMFHDISHFIRKFYIFQIEAEVRND
jgi:hypothetical protein